MKLVMSENLRIQVEAQRKYSGSNHPFILDVEKMMDEDFKDMDEAGEYANNKTSLGRTILFCGLGLIKKEDENGRK